MYSLRKGQVEGFNCLQKLRLTGSPFTKLMLQKSDTYFMYWLLSWSDVPLLNILPKNDCAFEVVLTVFLRYPSFSLINYLLDMY